MTLLVTTEILSIAGVGTRAGPSGRLGHMWIIIRRPSPLALCCVCRLCLFVIFCQLNLLVLPVTGEVKLPQLMEDDGDTEMQPIHTVYRYPSLIPILLRPIKRIWAKYLLTLRVTAIPYILNIHLKICNQISRCESMCNTLFKFLIKKNFKDRIWIRLINSKVRVGTESPC